MVMVSLAPVRYTPIWPEPAKSYGKSEHVIFYGDFAVNCEIDRKSRVKLIDNICLQGTSLSARPLRQALGLPERGKEGV